MMRERMRKLGNNYVGRIRRLRSRKGMEMVQVAILVAIAIGLGLIFRTQITKFVNGTFQNLMNSGF